MLWGRCEDFVLMDGKTAACQGHSSICVAVRDFVCFTFVVLSLSWWVLFFESMGGAAAHTLKKHILLVRREDHLAAQLYSTTAACWLADAESFFFLRCPLTM
jgi:hypothetical protein